MTVAALLVPALVLGACGGVVPSGLKAARGSARSVLPAVDDVLRRGVPLDEALIARLRSTSDDLGRFTDDLTRADHDLLAQLAERLTAAQAAADAAAAAVGARDHAASGAQAVAARAVRGEVKPAFLDDLEAVTSDVVLDVGCDLAADALSPAERPGGEGSDGPLATVMTAVTTAAVQRLASVWAVRSVEQTVDWTAWGVGVAELAEQLGKVPAGQIATGGQVHSQAFAYYVRLCHAPPS
jgi:hypothetical protein